MAPPTIPPRIARMHILHSDDLPSLAKVEVYLRDNRVLEPFLATKRDLEVISELCLGIAKRLNSETN